VSATTRPYILGIGGSTRAGSSSELAVKAALRAAHDAGATTRLIPARELELPMYAPERPHRGAEAEAFLREVAAADGYVIGTPGYHGSLSGLIKNALDYVEELRDADPPYFHDRAVGCVVCAHGWQATTTTLVALRSVVHALRGWPTPLGVAINTAEPVFGPDGEVADPTAGARLRQLGEQVVGFAARQRGADGDER
jgi:FMN reductase